MQKSIRLVVWQESDGAGAGEQAITSTNARMIYEPGAHSHVARRELHLGQFLNVDPGGEFAHRDGKKWRLHRFGHDFAKARIDAVIAAYADFVFLFVCRGKEGQSLDMIPMSEGDQ